jgi:hypothetical protein
MNDPEVMFRESGDRLAISMTVSVLLCELAGSDVDLLPELHGMLHEHVEVGLAEMSNDGSAQQEAVRAMYVHASAAVDRIFVMATRLRAQRHGHE